MTQREIPFSILAASIRTQLLENVVCEGVEAAVTLYYDNYTDATELDSDFLNAWMKIVEATMVSEDDVYEAINAAETRYCLDHADRVVCTPLPTDEDDEDDDERG